MKIIALAALLVSVFNSQAYAGKEAGNGGDEVALDFLRAAAAALEDIHSSQPALDRQLAPLNLVSVAESARVIVTNTPLKVDLDGVSQESIAVNLAAKNLIVINRLRWKQLTSEVLKRGIALHEVASLKGLESTGNYPFSAQYVSQYGTLPNILIGSTTAISPQLLDTIVNVPGEIQDQETITVRGVPGAGQSSYQVRFCRFERGRQGLPMINSLDDCSNHALGEAVHLSVGSYYVSYESGSHQGSSTEVDLGSGEQRTLSLAKLEVPKVDGSYSFTLYVDVTNAQEKDKFALEKWITNDRFQGEDCRVDAAYYPKTKRDCLAWKGENYRALIGTDFRTTNAAYIDPLDNYGTFATERGGTDSVYRLLVGSGHDGDFVSVFPGVYGMTFTSAGRHSTNTLGIIAK
jgi:hypothetical protein